MNAKNPKFAIAPKQCWNYLPSGKKYEMYNIDMDYFEIYSDTGRRLLCKRKECAHLYGGNWILRNK